MKGLLPLNHPIEEGTLLKKLPHYLNRYLPEWPGTEPQSLDFSFGIISTNMLIDEKGIPHSFRMSQLQHKESFSVDIEQAGCYVSIRLKGMAEAATNQALEQLVKEHTLTIVYLAAGKVRVGLPSGLGSSLVIDILPLLQQYAHNSHINALLDHIHHHPQEAFQLPVITMDFWLAGAVNLILNTGKNPRNMPNVHGILHQLIRMYLNTIDGEIQGDHKNRLQLHLLTGIPVGKNILAAGSDALEDYESIIQYLLLHIRKNYDKKTITSKSDLNASQFSRLFKQGYGKSFREGYTEIRMIQALQWVVEDKKLSEISQAIGYADLSAFSKAFKKIYGYPPSLYHWPYYNNESNDD